MKYWIDKQDQYVVFQLQEERLDTAIAPLLKSQFVTMNAEGVRNFILDLGHVGYADSSGLSALLVANRLCKESKGILVLTRLQPAVEKLIQISQLQNVLNILPSVEEGVDAVFMHEIEAGLEDNTDR